MVPSAVRSPVEDLAGLVGDFCDFERGVEAEADDFGVIGRGEADDGLGRQMMRGGVDLGVDGVCGDGQRGALRHLGGERGDNREGAEQNARQRQNLHSCTHRSNYRSHRHCLSPRIEIQEGWMVSRVMAATRSIAPSCEGLASRMRIRTNSCIMDWRWGPSGSRRSSSSTIFSALKSL